ncbi:MAG: beta-galactosidase [Alistipes sp.]|nr:beta-galactosidase [Alistipes senegalensis]MCM1250638.1 beta-galactosidase [Alistipes sp.]
MKRYLLTGLLLAFLLPAAAREIYPLNDGWRFFYKSETNSDNGRYVTLPHTWNTDPAREGVLLETTGNYRNNMFVPQEWSGKRIFVRFHGAQSVADLFVNGSHAGSHRGGAAAFAFEITDKLRFGTDNALLMVVSNASRNDVLPTSSDMNLYGGLYREAELILTDRTAVSPLYLGTDGVLVHQQTATPEKAEGEVEIHLTSKEASAASVRLDITAPDGRCVMTRRVHAKIDGKPLRIPYSIPSPQLWSPGHPALYKVSVSVGDGKNNDRVSVRTGFRSIRTAPAGGVLLNDTLTRLQGVVLYHDNAISGGTLRPTDFDRDLQEIRELGANALRSAVMPHTRYLYDRCDEQGMLVWVDTPLQRAPFLSDAAYFATPQFEQNGMEQLREIVAQNLNHPSVILWGIFSRIWKRGDDTTPYIRRLHDAAHELDPSRPTVAVSDQNGSINFVTDLIVWRQDVGWSKGKTDDLSVWHDNLQEKWSHLHSGIEYGGDGFIGHESYTAQPDPSRNRMPEGRQTLFHEEYARNLQNDSLFWGVWIENMFDFGSARRPYGINGMGLATLDRRTRKDAYYLYKALWNKTAPTLHITGRRHLRRNTPQQTFSVYSSAGEPLLLVNGDTVALARYAPCQYRSDTVELQGRVEVKASAGGLSDRMIIQVGNVSKTKSYPVPPRTTDR